jgi:hypothetical protein
LKLNALSDSRNDKSERRKGIITPFFPGATIPTKILGVAWLAAQTFGHVSGDGNANGTIQGDGVGPRPGLMAFSRLSAARVLGDVVDKGYKFQFVPFVNNVPTSVSTKCGIRA